MFYIHNKKWDCSFYSKYRTGN